ncbi:MAG: FtsX-like permease family protein [Thermoplasmata archaeon]|nr:MAG: FtsX-like permease family protein [Thermoplasmata archaeon]
MYPLKNLRRRSARTVLTISGVSLAITLAMIMFSISEGIRESTDEIIEKSGIEILVMPKGGDIFFGTGELKDVRELADEINTTNEYVKGAYPVLRERMYISTGEIKEGDEHPRVTSILAKGLSREANEVFETAKIIEGTGLPNWGDPFYANGTYDGGFDSQNFTHEIVLSSPLKDYLDADIGDTVYISTQLPVESFDEWLGNATWFSVKGIRTQSFEDEGDMAASLHLSELQYITGKWENDLADIIIIDLYNPSKAKDVKMWLENDFSRKDDISAFTQEDIRKEIERFTVIYRGFSELVAGITIVVALMFVSTVVRISVMERTNELATLRALGFSRVSIIKLVLAESVLILIIGFIIGLIIGGIGVWLINIYAESVAPGLPPGFEIAKITPDLLIRAVAFIIIVGVLTGLRPAYWASHLNIVDGLKSE